MGSSAPTIAHSLRAGSQQLQDISESPRLDSELLLAHCLQVNRSHLHAWPEQPVDPLKQQQFHQLLEKRHRGEPIAYLLGRQEFWSLPLSVNSDVLIPRPDTELLVEIALNLLENHAQADVADLGTGSGAIALALASERPDITVLASDICPAALNLAKSNANRLGIGNISFHQGHWLSDLAEQRFQMIVSNPPYIADDDPYLEQAVLQHEPRQALISAGDGLADLKAIAEQARCYLHPDGWLLLEHGWQQADAVRKHLDQLGYRQISSHEDLNGHPRISYGRWPGE